MDGRYLQVLNSYKETQGDRVINMDILIAMILIFRFSEFALYFWIHSYIDNNTLLI